MAKRIRLFLLISVVFGVLPSGAPAQSVDPLDGRVVTHVRVTGQRHLSSGAVERHLATKPGQPFRRATVASDRRRLDELRLFTAVHIDAHLENDGVVVEVAVTETLRLLPVVVVRVTDENGVSAGPGLRAINLLGHETQTGLTTRFGGETGASATLDATTITPGTWMRHLGFNYSKRRNTLYDFDERATSADVRIARNWAHGLRTGATAEVLAVDTGASARALSADGSDVIPSLGAFFTLDTLDSSTNPQDGTWAEVEVDRLFGDADSFTFILDGRRYQRLSDRHGLGLFSLATFQTGEAGLELPAYLQFSLGGANSVRGWSLGSRRGRHQFIGTVEYTYVVQPVRAFTVKGLNLYGGLQLVGFADVGLARGGDSAQESDSAIDGYGIGLRVLVPFVDVVRLDLAWGEPGRGATGYFAVSLKSARQRQRVR